MRPNAYLSSSTWTSGCPRRMARYRVRAWRTRGFASSPAQADGAAECGADGGLWLAGPRSSLISCTVGVECVVSSGVGQHADSRSQPIKQIAAPGLCPTGFAKGSRWIRSSSVLLVTFDVFFLPIVCHLRRSHRDGCINGSLSIRTLGNISHVPGGKHSD